MKISSKSERMPASAIRKLVPYAEEAAAQGVTVYRLNVGAPDIKSPDCALEEVERRSKSLHHLSYSHSAGLAELRKALVEKYYRPHGIDIDIDNLIVEVAGSEAFGVAMQIACDPGDEIIVIEPFYTNYQTYAYMNGITLKSVHTNIRDGFALNNLSDFEKALSPKTRAILISNPCNPSGKLFSKEEMVFLGNFCREHELFLISDEVYREFCYTDEPHFSAINIPGCEDNVILVDSVSKRYNLCGSRIGCIISKNKDVMAAALKYAQARLCPPVMGQYATLGALDTPQSYFDEVKAEYIRRRDYTIERLNAMEGVFAPTPLGAFYAIAELPVDDSEKFVKWMLTDFRLDGTTVMLTPIKSFYKNAEDGAKQVRIAYVLEVEKLKKAFDALEAGLKAYPGRKSI